MCVYVSFCPSFYLSTHPSCNHLSRTTCNWNTEKRNPFHKLSRINVHSEGYSADFIHCVLFFLKCTISTPITIPSIEKTLKVQLYDVSGIELKTHLPFSPGCKLLELLHIHCRLLSAKCLLCVLWLEQVGGWGADNEIQH